MMSIALRLCYLHCVVIVSCNSCFKMFGCVRIWFPDCVIGLVVKRGQSQRAQNQTECKMQTVVTSSFLPKFSSTISLVSDIMSLQLRVLCHFVLVYALFEVSNSHLWYSLKYLDAATWTINEYSQNIDSDGDYENLCHEEEICKMEHVNLKSEQNLIFFADAFRIFYEKIMNGGSKSSDYVKNKLRGKHVRFVIARFTQSNHEITINDPRWESNIKLPTEQVTNDIIKLKDLFTSSDNTGKPQFLVYDFWNKAYNIVQSTDTNNLVHILMSNHKLEYNFLNKIHEPQAKLIQEEHGEYSTNDIIKALKSNKGNQNEIKKRALKQLVEENKILKEIFGNQQVIRDFLNKHQFGCYFGNFYQGDFGRSGGDNTFASSGDTNGEDRIRTPENVNELNDIMHNDQDAHQLWPEIDKLRKQYRRNQNQIYCNVKNL